MNSTDDCIEICNSPTPTASVIWLHGLGADGNDFVPIVPELQVPETLNIRFLFPHAPVRPVTCNGGYEMRAWYDIYSLEDFEKEDVAGFIDSQQRVEALIAAENKRGISSDRIILMGFSQGGAIALHAGLRHSQKLAGIGALSTYLPMSTAPASDYSQNNVDTPIFMAHGLQDPVVQYQHGKASHELLTKMGYSIEWKDYNMEHNVCGEEILDISNWLTLCLQD